MGVMKTFEFVIAAVAVLAFMALILFIVCTSEDITDMAKEEYVVIKGDTLWSIARKHCPETMDKREYIYEVEKLNGIDGNIREGQRIIIYTKPSE
jgi:nucleoid-associated protein YgaU